MKSFNRRYPEFSLCGLNCGLCPRFQTNGKSKCPGCGGLEFYMVHPSCSVITCSQKHSVKEFCYECDEFPCKKYDIPMKRDSFISKKNFLKDTIEAKKDFSTYFDCLKEKQKILEYLIENYNDGRAKSFFCLAVNLLSLNDLNEAVVKIENTINADVELKFKTKLVKEKIEEVAASKEIRIELRK